MLFINSPASAAVVVEGAVVVGGSALGVEAAALGSEVTAPAGGWVEAGGAAD